MDESAENNLDEYQPILDAASEYEASRWVLGDAVLSICGPPGKPGVNNGSTERIKEAAIFLQDNGIDFTAKYLTEMRDISHLFPAPKRLGAAGISWSVFREFRSCPDVLLRKLKKNPDLIMKVSEAKQSVADHKARLQQREDNKAAKDERQEPVPKTATIVASAPDPVVLEPVEPQEPVVSEPSPIETDENDTQFVPEPEPEADEPKANKQAVKALNEKIVEAEDMFGIAVKLTNFVKSAHPDDTDWLNEMIDSVEKTQEELKKLKSLLRALSNKSKPTANGSDTNVTPFPMAAGDTSI